MAEAAMSPANALLSAVPRTHGEAMRLRRPWIDPARPSPRGLLRAGTRAPAGLAVVFFLTSAACADPAPGAAGPLPPAVDRQVDFVRDVEPLLAAHCHHCHGEDEQQARLRLDARAIVLAGGNSGPAIIPGRSEESLLVRRLAGHGGEPRMPSDAEPLDDESIGVIRGWIDQGAVWPAGVGSAATEVPRHWSHVAPVRPSRPKVAADEWCRTPLDFFVLAALEQRGLAPSPPADRATWLRRVSLDLVGLPPTIDDIDSFLADSSADAERRVVDRLLASPHFGERWARPWLDAARYGDSTGYHDDELRSSWPWRDWVIAALNADMPFDRFTVEQLAGDLLPEATLDQRVATGFHRASPFNSESGIPTEARRSAQLIDRVNVTATVWLGSTLECAQCHNHKYDPFTQRDYYRLLAYFNNTPDESGPAAGPGRDLMAGPTVVVTGTTTLVMQEMTEPRTTRIFLRGNYETLGETVSPGVPRSLHPPAEGLPANRLGLARWIVDPANPLTARVTVNRWWNDMFGAGIVRTPEDFGTQGERPTHPELLDWLAVELVENGWSMKRLLRLIVLSAAYGQSSAVSAASLTADPDGRWLSRAPRFRLPAEAVLDNAFAVSGLLSPAIGGPPVYPPQPDDNWWIRDAKSPVYRTSSGENRYRRSVYAVWRRNSLHPSLAAFDAPDRITCSVNRGRTNSPLQALTLLNDPIFLEAAFGLARRLIAEEPPASLAGEGAEPDGRVERRIARGFRLTTGRTPTAAETARLVDFYRSRLERFRADPDAARRLVESVRGDMAVGAPATPVLVELAAWFNVATVLLNLDETITKG
jgi:hypothetical protein